MNVPFHISTPHKLTTENSYRCIPCRVVSSWSVCILRPICNQGAHRFGLPSGRELKHYQLVVRLRFHRVVSHPLVAVTGFGKTPENLLRNHFPNFSHRLELFPLFFRWLFLQTKTIRSKYFKRAFHDERKMFISLIQMVVEMSVSKMHDSFARSSVLLKCSSRFHVGKLTTGQGCRPSKVHAPECRSCKCFWIRVLEKKLQKCTRS